MGIQKIHNKQKPMNGTLPGSFLVTKPVTKL